VTDRPIDDLELKLAYQERTIERLDEALREHVDRVDELEKCLARIESLLAGASEEGTDEGGPAY